MALTRLSSTDAFVVVDLDGAPQAAGVVRCARKILPGGARDLARHLTYAYASLGLQVSGASAGINAEGDDRDAAVAAFVEELGPRAGAEELLLTAGKGVRPEEIASLGPALPTNLDELFAAGVVAATAAVRDLSGVRVALEDAAETAAVHRAFEAAGAAEVTVGPGALEGGADVVGVGSKVGVVDHENVGRFAGAVVVPLAARAVTTRALATARGSDVVVLPDFVTTAGALVRGEATPDAIAARIGAIVTEVADHPEGHVLGACERAEEFLSSWRDDLPFGRPI